MKRFVALALLVGCASAQAADLPRKARDVPAPAPVIGTSPFYVGIEGGVGLSPTMNDFTIAGQSQQQGGPLKGYPTGILAGVNAGYVISSNPLYLALDISADYDFSRGCVGVACVASRKNGFLFEEGLEFGISMTQLAGYIPTSGQPQNWPIPITVPTSIFSNMVLAGRGGYAERINDLCVFGNITDPVTDTGTTSCGTKVIAAPFAGVKLKFAASTNWQIKAGWDHIFWGNAYEFDTPFIAAVINPTLIASQSIVKITKEDVFKIGADYHF